MFNVDKSDSIIIPHWSLTQICYLAACRVVWSKPSRDEEARSFASGKSSEVEWEYKIACTAGEKGRLQRAYARGGGDVSPRICSRWSTMSVFAKDIPTWMLV